MGKISLRKVGLIVSIPIVLSVFFLLSTWLASRLPPGNDYDFIGFWLAGAVVAQGKSVYDPAVWVGAHHFYGIAWIPDLTFLYPMPLGILFVPFAQLPPPLAYAFWDFLSMALILASVLILLGLHEPAFAGKALIPLLAGVISFRPVILVLLDGQLAGFLLAVLVFSIFLLEKERWFWGGFVISLLFLKPTIGVPVIGLFSAWLLMSRRWVGLAGVVSGALSLLLVGLLQNPGWVFGFLDAGSRKFTQTFGFQPTLWGISNYVCQPNKSCAWLAGTISVVILLLFVIFFLFKGRALRPLQAMEVIVAVGLLVTPYIWAYDQVLLLIPISAILFRLLQSRAPYLISALFPLAFSCVAWVLLGVAGYVGLDIWSGLLPCITVAISLYALRKTNSQEAV